MFKSIKKKAIDILCGAKPVEFISDIKDYSSINLETADFAYKISREYLVQSLENIRRLRTQVNLMLVFIFSVISFSIHEISTTKKIENISHWDEKYIFFLFWIILSYSIILVLLAIFGFDIKDTGVPGSEPKTFIKEKFVNQKLSAIKMMEAESYQRMIDFNHKATKQLKRAIRMSLYLLIFSSLFFAIPFFVLN